MFVRSYRYIDEIDKIDRIDKIEIDILLYSHATHIPHAELTIDAHAHISPMAYRVSRLTRD